MENTKIFESELEGGVKYEIHISNGFSGRSELALKVEGEIVSVMSVEIKRSGNIICRPSKPKTTLIKRECSVENSQVELNLDDVV